MIFSRPVASISNPVPRSSRLRIFPCVSIRPLVIGNKPAMAFSVVLFPAPLGPTMPTRSPSEISKLTPLSAWTSLSSFAGFCRRSRSKNSCFRDFLLYTAEG